MMRILVQIARFTCLTFLGCARLSLLEHPLCHRGSSQYSHTLHCRVARSEMCFVWGAVCSLQCIQYFSLTRSTQGIHRVYTWYTQGIHKIYTENTQGIHRVYTGFTQGMYTVYTQGIVCLWRAGADNGFPRLTWWRAAAPLLILICC